MNDGSPEATTSWPDTHGRWPWVAACAVLPATAAAGWQRERLARDARWVYWLSGPALLWHQSEEWVWPGGFLPWFNVTVMGATEEFPITRRAALVINVGLGWGLALGSSLAGARVPELTTVNLGLINGNIGVHCGQALRQRRYNPGLATAVTVFAPYLTLAVRRLSTHPSFGSRRTGAGVLAGVAFSALVNAAVHARARRSLPR